MMVIGPLYPIKLEELYHWGVRLLWPATLLIFLGIFLFFRFNEGDFSIQTSPAAARKTAAAWPYEEIGKGPLSLNETRSSQFIPRLGNELLLLGRNTRPDANQMESALLIGTKATGEERSVKLDETIYLLELDKEKEGRRGVRFSSSHTPLWVKPISMNRHSVTFEVYRFLESEQKEEQNQLVLSIAPEAKKKSLSLSQKESLDYVKAVKEIKHWGKDRLLEAYGGDEYRMLREKEKIQVGSDEGSSSVYFVSSGDFLIWDDGKWKLTTAQEISPTKPVVQIKSASPRGVEAELWDETGFFQLPVKVSPTQPNRQTGKETTPLFSSIRLRSGSQVTCIAGKRRLVLREGDWLLKTPNGWRNLKRMDQIEDCIHHRLCGELFIFDGLETSQGKTQMKGHLFDPMRSHMQTISFTVSPDKKTSKNKERRGKR